MAAAISLVFRSTCRLIASSSEVEWKVNSFGKSGIADRAASAWTARVEPNLLAKFWPAQKFDETWRRRGRCDANSWAAAGATLVIVLKRKARAPCVAH